MKQALIFVVITALAGVSGFVLQRHLAESPPVTTAEAGTTGTRLRPEFAMQDIDGRLRNISDWDGKIVLLNFWATWCPPCMKEIPDFIALQSEYGAQGLQIIGIAVDDEQLVRSYAEEAGMNYPVMAAEMEAVELSRRYGNQMGGLPYTVVINRKGEITDRITGELSKMKALEILGGLGLDV